MTEIIIAVVGGLLGGSAVAALINQIGEGVRQKRKLKADAESGESKDLQTIKTALRYVMLDRIRYLGQCYVHDKDVDFDDRRILNEMHNIYHNGLGGNGDLDILMQEVNRLPIRAKI